MADLALTDAQRDAFFKRLGCPVALIAEMREFADRFRLNRTRLILENELNGVLSGFDLTGVRIGENTDPDGLIYLRVFDETPGAGQARIRGYTTTADRTADMNHVFNAEGSDGTELTITEANTSGITGNTVDIGTVAANDSNPQLRVLLDWKEHFRNVFGGEIDDRLEDDSGLVVGLGAAINTIAAGIEGILNTTAVALLDAVIMRTLRTGFTSTATTPVTVQRSVDASTGAVTLTYGGVLADVDNDMEDNTGGSGEIHVAPFDLSAGAVTFDADNAGAGTATGPTMLSNARVGRYTFRLVKEFDTAGREEFSGEVKLDGEPVVVRGVGRLRVGAVYRDPALGISSFTINRSFTKTGDAGNADLAAAAAVSSIDGETTSNTASGQLGVQIDANASNWDISFYKTTDTSQFTSANLVARATNIATGAVFTATEQNGSGLTISWQVGTAPTDTNTVTLDINQFENQEIGGNIVADTFSFTVTKGTNRGRFNDIIARAKRFALNSDASPSVDDSFARANTFAELLQEP